MGRACSMYGELRNMYKILARKLERKSQLGRYWHRRGHSISIEIEGGGVDRINLDQGRGQWRAFVNMVMNLRVP
jgi:hypothetical protein